MFNLNFNGIKVVVVKAIGTTGFFLRRYGPEILTGAGIGGVVVSAVFACKATLKVQDVLDDAKTKVDAVHESLERAPERYTVEDSQRDLTIIHTQTVVAIGKLYALPVGLGIISIGCIMGGHHILRKENAMIAGAYAALAESFSEYRRRVRESDGDEKDAEYMYGVTTKEVETVDEAGNKTIQKVRVMDKPSISIHARLFGPNNRNWKKSHELRIAFLLFQQNAANDRFQVNGKMLLNEVYDMLDYQLTKSGAIVGWSKANGDTHVDFGLHNKALQNEAFLDGRDEVALLDFNVSGPILDLFPDGPAEHEKPERIN